MTIVELIHELRATANVHEPGTLYHLLHEAADRLEELEERLDIVATDALGVEEQLNHHDQEIKQLNKSAQKMTITAYALLILEGILIVVWWILTLKK